MAEAPARAPVTPPPSRHEVRDPETGQLLGWVNGDRALRRAIEQNGLRIVVTAQPPEREKGKLLLVG